VSCNGSWAGATAALAWLCRKVCAASESRERPILPGCMVAALMAANMGRPSWLAIPTFAANLPKVRTVAPRPTRPTVALRQKAANVGADAATWP